MLRILPSCVKNSIRCEHGALRRFSTTPRWDAKSPSRPKRPLLMTVPMGTAILVGSGVVSATVVLVRNQDKYDQMVELSERNGYVRYILKLVDLVKGSPFVSAVTTWPDKVIEMIPKRSTPEPKPQPDEIKSLIRPKQNSTITVPPPPKPKASSAADQTASQQVSATVGTTDNKTVGMKQERTEQKVETSDEKTARMKKEKEELLKREEENFKQEFASQMTSMVEQLTMNGEHAVEAQKIAAQAIRDHAIKLKHVLDSTGQTDGVDGEWTAVIVANQTANEAVSRADNLHLITLNHIEQVQRMVLEAKNNKQTRGDEALKRADEIAKTIKQNLNKAVNQFEKAQSDFSMIREYRDLIKQGREQFKQELESLNPDVKLGKRFGGRLNEEELDMLIGHAHKRIQQLQNQLAEARALELKRVEAAMGEQKREDDKVADKLVRAEHKRMLTVLEREKVQWEEQALDAQEVLLSKELARQEAAHTQHLANALREQETRLMSDFNEFMQEKLKEQKSDFHAEIAGSISKLRGIEKAVEARAGLEKQGRKAQELWLACQTLYTSIQEGTESCSIWQGKRKPLHTDLTAIREAGNEHPFVNVIVDTFSEESVKSGVWTETALYDRFKKVYRVCHRVAMIDERGGSLYKYFISYLTSIMILPYGTPLDENSEVGEDVSQFLLLDSAKYYMSQGHLEMAVRCVNQLKGEARIVASDWLKEARLTLEANQAAKCLLAHSSASGLGAIF